MKLPLLALFFLSGWAYAYIPPTEFILNSLAKKHVGPMGVLVKSKLTFFSEGKPDKGEYQEIVFVNFQNKTASYHVKNNVSEDVFLKELRYSELHLLLFEGNAVHLTKGLQFVPLDRSWLSRYKSTVAWVFGDKKVPTPQLWIEKDRFLPLQLLFQKESHFYALQFNGFGFYKEFPYPKTITLMTYKNKPEGEIFCQLEMNDFYVFQEQKEFKEWKIKMSPPPPPKGGGPKLENQGLKTYYEKILE